MTRSYLVESSVSDGVQDADFLLYVAANNTERCKSSVAYATYCQLEVKHTGIITDSLLLRSAWVRIVSV